MIGTKLRSGAGFVTGVCSKSPTDEEEKFDAAGEEANDLLLILETTREDQIHAAP